MFLTSAVIYLPLNIAGLTEISCILIAEMKKYKSIFIIIKNQLFMAGNSQDKIGTMKLIQFAAYCYDH